MPDLFDKCRGSGGFFGQFREEGSDYFVRPVLEGRAGPDMRFQGKDVIMWAINDYLGLCDHPEVQAAAAAELPNMGTTSPMGSRMLTGTTPAHLELEAELAAFSQKEHAILFNYGYMGVLGTIASLTGPDDLVVIDRLSHACMVDGAILASYPRRFRSYKHNDMASLESTLKKANQERQGGILIVVEGTFGMRGDLADLPAICDLAKRYEARIFVDDAHGYGVMGDGGRGTGEHLGVQDQLDVYFGTFAKAFASIGGTSSGPKDVIEWIRFNARPNIFAKSMPAIYVAALKKTLQIVRGDEGRQRRDKMWANTKLLQDGLKDLGFDLGDTASPITPVYVPAGSPELAMQMVAYLREEHHIFVSGVGYPVVPHGVVLFRMIPTASHTETHIGRTLEAYKALRDNLGLDLSRQYSVANR